MKLLIANLMVVLALGVVPAFAKHHQTIKVKINSEAAANGGLKVKFAELVEDSRCPTDTNCIWAGNAKIKVQVSKNGKSQVLELDTMGSRTAPKFGGYSFKLTGLTPEPRSNIRINRNGYVATIVISKAK